MSRFVSLAEAIRYFVEGVAEFVHELTALAEERCDPVMIPVWSDMDAMFGHLAALAGSGWWLFFGPPEHLGQLADLIHENGARFEGAAFTWEAQRHAYFAVEPSEAFDAAVLEAMGFPAYRKFATLALSEETMLALHQGVTSHQAAIH